LTQLHPLITRWLIKNSAGCVPDPDAIKELMCELGYLNGHTSTDDVCRGLCNIVDTAGFNVEMEVMECGKKGILLKFKGHDPLMNEFVAMIISLGLASLDLPYRIKSIDEPSTLMKIAYERGAGAYERVVEHFGYNQFFCDELKNRWDWWKWVVETSAMLNYKMIFITETVLENLIQGKSCPGGVTYIERKSGKYCKEIPFDEFFLLLRELFKNARIIDEMTYHEDSGEILIYHNFRDPVVIEQIAEWIENLIKIHWANLEHETSAQTTVFRRIEDAED
ncbi:hypothetical protein DRN98_06185, partial [Methanosarcinales archaeon]